LASQLHQLDSLSHRTIYCWRKSKQFYCPKRWSQTQKKKHIIVKSLHSSFLSESKNSNFIKSWLIYKNYKRDNHAHGRNQGWGYPQIRHLELPLPDFLITWECWIEDSKPPLTLMLKMSVPPSWNFNEFQNYDHATMQSWVIYFVVHNLEL